MRSPVPSNGGRARVALVDFICVAVVLVGLVAVGIALGADAASWLGGGA